MGGEPGREAQLQEGAARESVKNPMGRAMREGKFEYPEYRRPMDEEGGGGPARGRGGGGGGGSGGGGGGGGGGGEGGDDGGDEQTYPDAPVPPRGVATGDRGVRM